MKKSVTTKELRELLDYDKDTGIFTWKKRAGPRGLKGAVAGTVKDTGYLSITIKGKEYSAHRLAWWYVYGEMPKKSVGHKESDRLDNSIENLYLSTNSRQYKNTKLNTNNTSGFTGVNRKPSGKWQARIKVDGKSIFLGSFEDKKLAIEARRDANKKYGFGAQDEA